MLEFLQAYWLWLLIGAGVLWFLFRQGGCGMGGHGSHHSGSSQTAKPDSGHEHSGQGDERRAQSGARRSGRGCC